MATLGQELVTDLDFDGVTVAGVRVPRPKHLVNSGDWETFWKHAQGDMPYARGSFRCDALDRFAAKDAAR